jgi:hypothetical protein
MALPIKKVYVDSKYKTKDSISDSNFKFELPQTILTPHNCVFFVDDVAIPHSWYTVNDHNYKLFLRTIDGQGAMNDYVLYIPRQVYNGSSFASQLGALIQSATSIAPQVVYSASKHTISVFIGSLIFSFLTDEDMRTDLPAGFLWNGDYYDKNNLASANDLIGNNSKTTTTHTQTAPYEKPLILNPIRNIYIHSPNLGNFNTFSANGQTTVIKKVPVTNNFGEMIFDSFMASNDSLDCSRQTLKTLEFRLTDVDGVEIPLNGNYCSFSIVFDQMNPKM